MSPRLVSVTAMRRSIGPRLQRRLDHRTPLGSPGRITHRGEGPDRRPHHRGSLAAPAARHRDLQDGRRLGPPAVATVRIRATCSADVRAPVSILAFSRSIPSRGTRLLDPPDARLPVDLASAAAGRGLLAGRWAPPPAGPGQRHQHEQGRAGPHRPRRSGLDHQTILGGNDRRRTAPAARRDTPERRPRPDRGPRDHRRFQEPASARTRTGRFATTGPVPAPRGGRRRPPFARPCPAPPPRPSPRAPPRPALPRPRPRRAAPPPTARAPEPRPRPPRPAARATSRATATPPPRRFDGQPPHARIGQPAARHDGAAPRPSRSAQHDQRAGTDDDVRKQRERVPRPAAPRRVAGKPPGAARRAPARASRPRARNTGTTTTLPVSAAGSQAGRELGGRARAVASTPRTAATTLTRGPGFVPDHDPRGNRRQRLLAGAGPRRQRDGDGARFARCDRDATNPNTACGELDQHV